VKGFTEDRRFTSSSRSEPWTRQQIDRPSGGTPRERHRRERPTVRSRQRLRRAGRLARLGAIVAGVVFLDPLGGGDSAGGNGGESATRYATVDLGNRSPAVAERVADGTTSAPDLTITDTYVGPTDGKNLSVVVRVRIDGTLTDGEESDGRSITFADTRVQRGSDLDIETAEYDVAGEVLELSTAGRR